MTPTENFISHLIELRDRLLRTLIGFALVLLMLLPFANKIYSLLAAPLLAQLPSGGQMIATAVTTPFFVPMKVAMMAAFIISLPHTMYQAWSFVAPGLYAHEKKFMVPMIVASCCLFLMGMAFAYFLVLPVIFGFIISAAPVGVAVMTDIANYLDFVIGLFFAFGLAFQVPIAVILVVYFGWLDVIQLKAMRAYVVVVAFILGAIFTPPDVVSQFMLALPICLLYELGILLAGFITKANSSEPDSPA
ncbi:TatC Sec-independent protein secretion pathway component TatC [Methylophilaceae bacterium]